MSKMKLAVICSHPIQYYAPLFRALAAESRLQVLVFYTWSQSADGETYDSGFQRPVGWDVPLLEDYDFTFVPNLARRPGTDGFFGLINPDLIPGIESWEADAILVFGWCHYSHLRVLHHFKGRVPVLFRGDSTLLDPVGPLRRLLRRLVLSWVYRSVDIVLAVGSHNRDYYRWCGVAEPAICLAPHCVDNSRFSVAQLEDEGRAWRARLGLKENQVAIVYAGKFQLKKDPALLLDAYSRLSSQLSCALIFVGGGTLEIDLRARAADVPNVHFLPFQNQSRMPSIYRLADVFVLPSRGPGETWGLALNEALASGRAVIASDRVGAARDLIEPGRNGWCFPAQNVMALAGVLEAAVRTGRDGLRAMGRSGQGRIAGWSIAKSAAAIADAAIQASDRHRAGAGEQAANRTVV